MPRIFAFWTGDNPMPEIRKECWDSFALTGLEPTLVTAGTLQDWVVPEHPLHAAYEYLSPVHRSDYLRPYFMYFHGGGYSDIKRQQQSWLPAVDRVHQSPRLSGAGYREIRGGTVALHRNIVNGSAHILSRSVPKFIGKRGTDALRVGRPLIIGNCAFYFKPRSDYVKLWLSEVERRLDVLLPDLRRHPAQHPRDRLGGVPGEKPSGYPVPWSFILGDIMGPLSLLHWRKLSRQLPPPMFHDYDPLVQTPREFFR